MPGTIRCSEWAAQGLIPAQELTHPRGAHRRPQEAGKRNSNFWQGWGKPRGSGDHFLEEMVFELRLQGMGGAPSMSKLT